MKYAVIVLIAAVMMVAMPRPVAAQLELGLLAHYLFEANANDISGNNYHGTLFNGVASTTDRFGRSNHAFLFDGYDDRVKLHGESINGLTDLTMSFWLQTTDVGIAKHFVSAARPGDNNEFLIRHDNGRTLVIDTGRVPIFPGPSYNDGNWHQLAFTRSSSRMDLYLDGVWASNLIAGSSALTVDSNGLWLGGDQDIVAGAWDPNQQFQGRLDDVRIYNRTLSGTEVGELYNLESIPEPSTVFLLVMGMSSVALLRRHR